MIIKPPSLQAEYTLIFSGDPSLVLPADEAAAEKALSIARETGQWAAILSQGQGESPTLFHVRPLIGSLRDWLGGEVARRDLAPPEAAVLALRLALRRIEGFGTSKVTWVRENGQQLVDMTLIDEIYAVEGIGRKVVQELGDLVLLRTFEALRPKS